MGNKLVTQLVSSGAIHREACMYSAWHTVDPRKWQVINKVIIPKKERKGLRLGLSDREACFCSLGP